MELIIGANGYIGRHLASSRRGRDCTLHSASPPNSDCARTGLPFLQEDLVQGRAQLSALNPETVFLLARPVTMDPGVLLDFAQNVQWLLQEWADRGCLRRVVFASTQLVYATPPDATPIPVLSPLGPQTPYDCHKAEMEFFLSLLSHHSSLKSIDVHRLPLVAGKAPGGEGRNMQFLFYWRRCYLTGSRWVFDTGEPRQDSWGNSWVHMDDVVRAMGEEPGDGAQKYRVRQPVSGHFTYRELDAYFTANYPLPPARERLHLSHNCFFLSDNTGTRATAHRGCIFPGAGCSVDFRMNIVHIDMPRFFTFTVKEYLVEAKREAESAGHTYRQYDANPPYWRWLMQLSTPYSRGDCLDPVLKSLPGDHFWESLAEIQRHLRDISTLYGAKVTLRGLELPRQALDSTYAMCSLIADNFGCMLFSGFFQRLDERVHFSGADLISIGCDYQEGVLWALNLAAWMRARNSKAHICIARHGFENFSLLHHIDRLVQNEWFFGLIDSVILHDEELPATLRNLASALEGGDTDRLDNIAIKSKGTPPQILPLRPGAAQEKRRAAPDYTIPGEYFEAMDVPPEHLVYSMAMVRNKCFYKKCTFCVQITKHLSDAAFEPSTEIDRALNACAELTSHGVRLVNFMDEAMRPVDLREFSEAMLAREIPVSWVGRMIAAAHPDEATLRLMHSAGCVEILFGIESFEPAVLRDMGKISGRRETSDETVEMIKSYLSAGMFVILSMIYDFPSENAAARATTRELVERIADPARMAFIFNRFALFHTSAVFKEPAKFGIGEVEARLPQNDIQYAFAHRRQSETEPLTTAEAQSYQHLKFGLNAETYAALAGKHGQALLDMAHFFDYNSIGFVHRVRHDTTLLASLLERETAVSVDAE